MFIYNYSYAGGLFQEEDIYMVYLSNYYWNDFKHFLMKERDVLVKEMCVIFDINVYLKKNLRYEPTFSCITHPNYVANFSSKSIDNAAMFECFKNAVDFETIQRQLDLFEKVPYEFEIVLKSGVRIEGELWDDCTFHIPGSIFKEFYKLLQKHVLHFKNPILSNSIVEKPNNIFHLDATGSIVDIEKVDNFEIYMYRLYHVRNELICSSHVWEEE